MPDASRSVPSVEEMPLGRVNRGRPRQTNRVVTLATLISPLEGGEGGVMITTLRKSEVRGTRSLHSADGWSGGQTRLTYERIFIAKSEYTTKETA